MIPLRLKITSRWQAFGVHLFISTLILIALLSVVFFFWYPNDLIHAGGIVGLKILFGVDIVLGPLLTLIVFVPYKKGLAMDLTLIGALQTACLSAGLWIIYNQRPVLEVIADDGVHIVSASDAQKYHIDLKKIPGRLPKKVMIDLPVDKNTWPTVKFASEFADGKPFSTRQDLYKPLIEVQKSVYDDRVNTIISNAPEFKARLTAASCSWIPLISIHTKGYACVSQNLGIESLSSRFFSQ